MPICGGPFVLTQIDAEDNPHDRVKMYDDVARSILLLITKFKNELLPTVTGMLNDDAAALLKLNEVLLFTVQLAIQIVFVKTFPVKISLTCGLIYVRD